MNNYSTGHTADTGSSIGCATDVKGHNPSLGPYTLFKRAADIVLASIALVVISPLMLLVAILIRIDSPGPALFRQVRVGKNGVPFTLIKFRTMEIGTPILPTEQMKNSTVSYHTKAGRALRRFSVDELPQLWNVVKGEMSLIGPRPSLQSQVWLNAERRSRRVLDIRPGITGLAQISGRDELTDSQKVEYDAVYRRKMSIWLDLRIAFGTIFAIFSGAGAN